MTETPDDHGWRADAACLEYPAEMWFPETGDPAHDARRICSGCPVKTECLLFALEHKTEFGIFGGLGYKQRVKLNGAAA